METKRFIYYEEDGLFVGWLEECPDYRTQGETQDAQVGCARAAKLAGAMPMTIR
jgi:hypothetical protein